jgi:hypothetical protein
MLADWSPFASASRLLKFAFFGTVSDFQSLLDGVCGASLMALRSIGCSIDGSCCGLDELWQADQIVAGHCEGEFETELFDTP